MTDANRPAEPPKPLPPLVVNASALLQGRTEIIIVHEGVQYRLRVTKRRRLLLQK